MTKFLVLLIPALIAFAPGCGYNEAISDEQGIAAAWEDNMNVRDSMVKQIGDAMSVAETDRATLSDAIEKYMTAQNPEDGRGQFMQWTQNAGVQITSENFARVIDIMEAKRNEFQNSNTRLRERQRAYGESLGALPNGPILTSIFGFPKTMNGCSFNDDHTSVTFDPYCPPVDKDKDGRPTVLDFPVIVSGDSKSVFASGNDNWTISEE